MALISQRQLRLLAFCSFLILLAALFIGGHQPASGRLFPPPWDKAVHFAFYGILTTIAGLAFPKIRILLLGLMIIAIGGIDEIHQIFVPGRQPGLDDLAADALGCLPALLLVIWLRKKFVSP